MNKAIRILIVCQNWMGDVLFSTPAIRALRRRHPDGFIACLVPPRAASVLKNNPAVNEVIVYDGKTAYFKPSFWRALARLRRFRFDTAVLFHRSRTKARLLRWAGIPEIAGYSVPGRGQFLTRPVAQPPEQMHRIDYFLNLVSALGAAPDGRKPDLFPDEGDEASLEKKLAALGFKTSESYVVVHPGGNWHLKRWPARYFAEWIRRWLSENPEKILLCGSAGEEALAREILSQVQDSRVSSLCGSTSVGELGVLMRRARLLVSNDSGPIHVAASQGTPILGVYGPTSARITRPVSDGPVRILAKDVGCGLPCYFRSCHYRVCMDWLTPQEAIEEAKELLCVKS